MATPPLFPIYPDSPNGPFHVSFSINPPIPSEISKNIGITASPQLLIPNIDYLQKFAEGDIGLGDGILKDSLAKNFASPQVSSSEENFKKFAKIADIQIDDAQKYKKDSGFKLPKEQINIPSTQDFIGLKGLEKSLIKSIFETQKPYIEIINLVIANIAKIEDITARVMPLLTPNPLSALSEKPISNAGKSTRPKSLGLGGGQELKDNLSKINKLSKSGTTIKVSKDGTLKREKTFPASNPTQPVISTNPNPPGVTFSVISVVYSTGEFSPFVDYQYTYVDIPPASDGDLEDEDLKLDSDGDPFKPFKPERIILGIWDSKGAPLNPNEFLKTVSGVNPNGTINFTNTPFKKADWILRSPKWALPSRLSDNRPTIYTWPTFDIPTFRWIKWGLDSLSQDRQTKPDGDGWEVKKYKKDERNILTGEVAIEGAPVIVGFNGRNVPGTNTTDEADYREYFNDLVDFAMLKAEDLTQEEKNEYSTQIKNTLNIRGHLENVALWGQSKSSIYEQLNLAEGSVNPFPDSLKVSFKPFLYYSPEAALDENCKKFAQTKGRDASFIWIDPETDYDLKVIRVDPTTNIEYEEAQGEAEIPVSIQSFVKNKLTIKVAQVNSAGQALEGINFGVEITKNGIKELFNNISQEYVLENWNYISDVGVPPERRFVNNTFGLTVWSEIPTRAYWQRRERIVIKSEILTSNVRDLLNRNNNLIWVYELIYENERWYYKRFKWLLSTSKLSVLLLIGVASQELLISLISQYDRNPNADTKISFRVADIFSTINQAVGFVNNELYELGVPKKIEFTFLSVAYKIELRIDRLLTRVREIFGSQINSDLGKSIIERIKNFQFSYNFKLRDLFQEKIYEPLPIGVTRMKDDWGTRIEIDSNGSILKWFYIYERAILPFNPINPDPLQLPPFGKQFTVTLNHNTDPNPETGNINLSRVESDIPLWGLKVGNQDFPYGKVVDPSKVTNDLLANSNTLYSNGKYGHGSEDLKQSIGVLKRFMLTDTDTESYWIIEGVLTDRNTRPVVSSTGADGSTSYYKLPDAIGATRPFIEILVNIFSKLVPKIQSLLKLLEDPRKFIVDVVSEKLGEGFDFLSKDSLGKFTQAQDLKREGRETKSDYVKKVDTHFKSSKLRPLIFTRPDASYVNLLDGLGLIPFSMFGKQLDFGMEFKMKDLEEQKPPFKLVTPFSVLNSSVKNLQTYNSPRFVNPNRPPGSISPNELRAAQVQQTNLSSEMNKIPNDIRSQLENYEIISVKYSTGEFIEGVDYNFIYIDMDVLNLVNESDSLVEGGSVADLDLAKQKLEKANTLDPGNELVKSRLKDLKKLKNLIESTTQPLLKFILGIATTPIKIISGIISWLLDFFKSLTNPLTLPVKMVELLTFGWFKQFFTPVGLLDIAGIKFKVEKLAQWIALVNIPNPIKTGGELKIPPGLELPPDLSYKHPFPKGDYLIPDDYEIADLNLFLNIGFNAKLPTYTAKQIREYPQNPLRLMAPVLCFIEKLINEIINFFWSLIGLEAIIPAPKIKICKNLNSTLVKDRKEMENLTPEQITRIISGEEPSGQSTDDVVSDFVYEIQLEDGTILKDLDSEKLQEFIEQNRNISFEFTF